MAEQRSSEDDVLYCHFSAHYRMGLVMVMRAGSCAVVDSLAG